MPDRPAYKEEPGCLGTQVIPGHFPGRGSAGCRRQLARGGAPYSSAPSAFLRTAASIRSARLRGLSLAAGLTARTVQDIIAYQQLGGPLVIVWDNSSTHVSAAMADLIVARDWLTVCQLPPYARELNPVEPVWSHLKRSLAKRNNSQLTALVKTGLKMDAVPARPPRQHRPRPHTLP